MTCIVGIVGRKGVLIAGDQQTSGDNLKRYDTGAKVFNLFDTVAVGYCGSGRFGQILEHHMNSLEEPPVQMDERRWLVRDFVMKLRSVTEEHGHLHVYHNVEEFGPSEFLIAVRGRLFCIEQDFSVNENQFPFEATGSGAEAALGVLHKLAKKTPPEARIPAVAADAINAASNTTLYVGGGIDIVRTVRWTADEKALARSILR